MVSPAGRGALLRESDGHVFPSVRARHQPACPPAGFSAIWGQTLTFFPQRLMEFPGLLSLFITIP